MIPKIKQIDELKNYYGVRFRIPSRFSMIRIPNWASKVSQSISKGSKVKMGKLKDSGNWKVQSVLIVKKYRSRDQAKDLAKRIVQKIEE